MMASIYIKRFNDNCLFALTALFVLVCLVISCGKKGPPVPPRYIEPPAITDLTSQIEADQITLTWGIPEGKRGVSVLVGFFVYRSRKAITAAACKDCPILFTRIANVPIQAEMLEKKVATYSETLEKGFRYIYKVTAYTNAGLISGDSNYVEFTY